MFAILYVLLILLNVFPIEYLPSGEPQVKGKGKVKNPKGKDPKEKDPEGKKPCPILSARSAPDEYLVKIVAETTEMLCAAYRAVHGEPTLLKERRDAESKEGKSLEEIYHSGGGFPDGFPNGWSNSLIQYCHERWEEMGRSELISKHTRPIRMRNENHPMSKWTRESRAHFIWVCRYGLELADEHLRRPLLTKSKPKMHMYRPYLEWFFEHPLPIDKDDWVDMPACMDKDCIVEGDIVQSYRNWVQRKYCTYNVKLNPKRPGPSKWLLKRVINWRRDPSTRPSYIYPGLRENCIKIYKN